MYTRCICPNNGFSVKKYARIFKINSVYRNKLNLFILIKTVLFTNITLIINVKIRFSSFKTEASTDLTFRVRLFITMMVETQK